jgi:hypothetical protein
MHVPMSTPKDSKKRLFPSAQGWGEGRVDQSETIAEIDREQTRPLSGRKALSIARSHMRKSAHGAIQLAEASGDALPSPQPSPTGEGASKICLDRSCAVAGGAAAWQVSEKPLSVKGGEIGDPAFAGKEKRPAA